MDDATTVDFEGVDAGPQIVEPDFLSVEHHPRKDSCKGLNGV